ncbi:CRISPR-associated endonuclease Csn1 [Bacteroides zoogleoformans]|uniref:CRISPR-associated endonuclease Cas9 n=1 Tax=Bacteroides zoogleoformans TaxID=28119 RepID=A0ABN5IM98_9BACE|nr:type II CRISPR RNA-guided endonuclease Cas9 [Bacteroides zoogleoformans]AVM53812.1 CRISPR-associated protein Csn1 [Bacteroides zoogleoformans]TWJ18232.1 CRISPR-associated endonuclease Csn1 [Bacteroides zoogleoformans]
MKQRVLGLDTGTNSLGWAVVDRDENNYELIRRGDLIFTEGVKIEKGNESSKAAECTAFRAQRRFYFRRRLRKIEVLKVLVVNNLCPFVSDEELHLWHTKKQYPKRDELMLWQRTNDNEQKNPYYYRHICLHRTLDLENIEDRYMLGRALYHLTQRRGFLSNRLDTSSDSNEDGTVKSGIGDLNKEMEAAGCEFLGDYFYRLYHEEGNRVKIRNHYTDREAHYLREFNAICEKQHLKSEVVEALRRAIFFQRPLKSQRKGVGKCTFEPKKPRCAMSHPDYEEFRRLSFVNNIQIKTPYDLERRPLNKEERARILPLFYRKGKSNFDFEDIAKALSGKNNYCYEKEDLPKEFKFNYRMAQGVSKCKVTAQLRDIFGDDWKQGIAEIYLLTRKKEGVKTLDEMADDVWNVLYSFSSKDKLKEFAMQKLQLDEATAEKFSKIEMPHDFAALSLKAIRNILPFLRQGMIYSHAVLLANIPAIVSKEVWADEEKQRFIIDNLYDLIINYNPKDREVTGTIEWCIKDFLKNNFDLAPGIADKLYHPSMIETYEDAKRNRFGVLQLGSPMTNAVRNPMAMRSLHMVRKVVNQLLRDKTIDEHTEVHVEYARELNDANRRKAIADYQKDQEKKRVKYRADLIGLYKEETGKDITPTDDEVLKFQLWEEQDCHCLYTGQQIGIADFMGSNPQFDIEHTIPRSVGGDSTQMNLTLCENRFNRDVKRAQIPTQLANHEDIMVRIAPWKEHIDDLSKQIDRMRTNAGIPKDVKDRIIQKRHRLQLERNYWYGKYERFTMTEVPEGFSRRQGMGIGLVSKYAGLFLKSLFHDPQDRNKSHVYVVKGTTTAEFRKMWGLQNEYDKKSRVNHSHHCIDAITIACIGKGEYNEMAHYYHDEEASKRGAGQKPQFKKPWPTFTEDVLAIEQELLVVHSTPDNMAKHAKKYVRTAKGKHLAKGDCARGVLHQDTYYGAIERNGEVKYVVRRLLSSFEKIEDLDKIVDETVKQTIKEAVAGKEFKKAINEPIYMNKEKEVRIKKVRCFAPNVTRPMDIRNHRDMSRKDYKQKFHVMNDSNYMMAIYEGIVKNKVKREFAIIKNMDAAQFFKSSQDRIKYSTIVPEKSVKSGLPLKELLKIGMQVLLYENTPEEINFNNLNDLKKRLYKVVGLSSMLVSSSEFGVLKLRHHEEARPTKDIKFKNGKYMNDEQYRSGITLLHTQFFALVEGVDFDMNILGEIKLKS